MYDVILFGGTDEGHKIADFLYENGVNYIVCVATDYGARLLHGKNVRVGRMDGDEMESFMDEYEPRLVIDATHPYADKVTENIKKACRCEYIRVSRIDTAIDYGICFDTVSDAVEYLKKTDGEILITTGSKEILRFASFADRAYARVLAIQESVRQCVKAGFKKERIISEMPPFTKEENAALMREKNIKYLVTKRTGKSGGFYDKISAAKECGVECVIINRPSEETGLTVEETKKRILEWL